MGLPHGETALENKTADTFAAVFCVVEIESVVMANNRE